MDLTVTDVKQNIIVAGYFDKFNLGDDLFKDVWKYLFSLERLQKHKVSFLSLEQLERYTESLAKCDILIFAGGDVLNYYFLSNLKTVLAESKFSGKLYGISIGVPYDVVVVDGLLDQFNFLMCRAMRDAFVLRNRFGENHVRYFPDLAVYLPKLFAVEKPKQEFLGIKYCKKYNDRLNIGVFLTRNIFEKNEHYEAIVKNMAKSMDDIIDRKISGTCGFEIFLIPFNTNPKKIFEDDRLINQDIHAHVKNTDYIHVVDKTFSLEEMNFVFKNQLDMNVTMRYHSHMFSIVNKVPFVSIFTTKKVKNLLSDVQLTNYSYELPVNEHDLPLDFSPEIFAKKFTTAFSDRTTIVNKQKNYLDKFVSYDHFENTLFGLIECPPVQVLIKQRVYPLNTITKVISSMVEYVWKSQNKEFSEKDVSIVADEIYKNKINFATVAEIDKMKDADVVKLSDFLAALACYGLVNIPYPKYHFGMSQKILSPNFHAKNEFMWVWGDYQKGSEKFFIENPVRRKQHFNATLVGTKDFKGCHRSGWQYTLDHLMGFHSENSNLIFDNYIDRTFHWAHDVYKYTGLVPFKQPWCGFIHHTFDENYSPFNVPNLFRNESFIESLNTCVAIFTLSADLALKIKVLLQQYGFKKVLVKSFTHPTETSSLVFSMDKFLDNEARKVVHVGAWLRDNYAIYKLRFNKKVVTKGLNKKISLHKAVLKGKDMHNYFKPEGMELIVKNVPLNNDGFTYKFQKDNPPLNFTVNKFALGLLQDVHEAWSSVEILETLDDDQYDKLLSENIVFLCLVDASAVNTVIECIVRCTPVLINKHPAVEEMLGAEYPFYYDDLTDAGVKVNDLDLIRKTFKYLVNMPKKRFSMEYFLEDIDAWFLNNAV